MRTTVIALGFIAAADAFMTSPVNFGNSKVRGEGFLSGMTRRRAPCGRPLSFDSTCIFSRQSIYVPRETVGYRSLRNFSFPYIYISPDLAVEDGFASIHGCIMAF
jgi:hypothetical protein